MDRPEGSSCLVHRLVSAALGDEVSELQDLASTPSLYPKTLHGPREHHGMACIPERAQDAAAPEVLLALGPADHTV